MPKKHPEMAFSSLKPNAPQALVTLFQTNIISTVYQTALLLCSALHETSDQISPTRPTLSQNYRRYDEEMQAMDLATNTDDIDRTQEI